MGRLIAYKEEDIQLVLQSLDLLSTSGTKQAKALGGAAQILELNSQEVKEIKEQSKNEEDARGEE